MPDSEPTYYTVVQYVPDPIAGERMNIGIIAFRDGNFQSKFFSRWQRASTFGEEKVDFLKEFAKEVQDRIEYPRFAKLEGEQPLTEEWIREACDSWQNSIQLTDPRASIREPRKLVEVLSKRFLREPEPQQRARDRRHATKLTYTAFERSLSKNIGRRATEFLSRGGTVSGAKEPHEMGITLTNGQPLLGAEGFSFEVKENARVKRALDSVIYKLDDIRDKFDTLSLGLVALPPQGSSDLYRRANSLCEQIEVELVPENEIGEWASETTLKLKDELSENGAFEEE